MPKSALQKNWCHPWAPDDRSLEPCQIEVVGVAGSLPIFGIGTAIFALCLPGGSEIVVRIHNCLYSFGEFNLLSVSQMQTNKRNKINLSLENPSVRLYSTDSDVSGSEKQKRTFIDVPLTMDDGLYALTLEPVSSEDTRYQSLRMFDFTPPRGSILRYRRGQKQRAGYGRRWYCRRPLQ